MIDRLWQDIRFVSRTLLKTPAFTVIVVLTLGLGIGANTAIFSVMDQVLLRSLPVKHPEQLVAFRNPGAFSGRMDGPNTFSYPMYRDFRDRNTVFAGVVASYQTPLTATIDGRSERVNGDLVTGNYFEVLGVSPLIGRAFTREDDVRPGGHPVAILSYGYWQRRFAGDPAIVNRTISLNGLPMTVVGITPPAFRGIVVGAAPDVMVPVAMKAQMTPDWDDLQNRRSRWLTLLARLAPGVSREQAEAAMNVIYHQVNELELSEMPAKASDSFKRRFLANRLTLEAGGRGGGQLTTQFTTPILVLMGMVGLVLLIACANVANLLLARGAARQKDIAIRMALGAGRGAILRQRLVESTMLALTGGALAVPFAWWCGSALLAALPSGSGIQGLTATPDARVIGFACAAALVTALLSGLAPALQSTRPELTSTLKDEATSVAGGPSHVRFRKTLVVAQVALSILLLAGAGLFARSLYNLKSLNPGFRADGLLAFSIDPMLSGYSRERSLQLFDTVQKRIAAVPGVVADAPALVPLMTDSQIQVTVKVEGYSAKDMEDMNPWLNVIGPGYFTTIGQPLVAGREFTDRDAANAPKVAIINETMARYYFGTGNALGHRIGLGRGPDSPTDIEIVGVAKDAKFGNLKETVTRFVYLPYHQSPFLNRMTFYARTPADPASIIGPVRSTVQQLDPNLPVFDVKTMRTQVDESLFVERAIATLSMVFGALATLLAGIGLYGVMSYTVARRTREIGIRMALGADRGGVMWMVQREVVQLVAAGVIVGVPCAIGLGRLVRSQLFDLSPADPAALGTAAALLAAVALLAGYLPARRATRIDPMLALRCE